MPIFVIILVVFAAILAIWWIQRSLQEPAKTLLIALVAVLLLDYLFNVFGLLDVRIR